MSQEQPNAHYEMYTLHSPPASPQQAQGQFQTMDYHQPQPQPQPQPDISSEQIVSQYAYYAPQGEISYTHQERHPALDFRTGYISPGLPPPGTEPPYTSQPNSPSFPPKPYQPKPDGNINGSTNPRMPPRIHTRIPYDAAKDIAALRTPIYTPGNIAGPNGGIHAPGQISHPNMRTGVTEKWANSAWACFGDWEVCCTAYWCPCILYSRTKHRLKTVPNSNLNNFRKCNPHCMVFCAAGPCSWILTFLQRAMIRERYKLDGSPCSDCLQGYCCSCCTLIQDEREVMLREDEKRRFEGPGNGVVGEGYKRVEGMKYGR